MVRVVIFADALNTCRKNPQEIQPQILRNITSILLERWVHVKLISEQLLCEDISHRKKS